MLVFGTWFLFRYEGYSLPATAFKVTLIKVIDLAALVYFTNYVLIPKLLYKKKYILFAVILISLIVLSSLLKMNIIGRMTNNPALLNISGNWKARVYDNVLPHIFLVLAGAAFKLMFDYTAMQKKMADMAKERAEAELSFLKSQINPHFLFNNLSVLSSLVYSDQDKAVDFINQLSKVYRYLLENRNSELTRLSEEMAFIHSYIYLLSIRFDKNINFTINVKKEDENKLIPPLALQILIENAIKHNEISTASPLQINIITENDMLIVSNTLQPRINKETSSNLGLDNIRQRYQYYSNKEVVVIQENQQFIVKLPLLVKL